MYRHNLQCIICLYGSSRLLAAACTQILNVLQPLRQRSLLRLAILLCQAAQLFDIGQLAGAVFLLRQNKFRLQLVPKLCEQLRQCHQRCCLTQAGQAFGGMHSQRLLLRRQIQLQLTAADSLQYIPQRFVIFGLPEELRQRRIIQTEIVGAQSTCQLQACVTVVQCSQQIQNIQNLLLLIKALALNYYAIYAIALQRLPQNFAMRHCSQQNSLACSRPELRLYFRQLLLQIGSDCLCLLLPFILFSAQVIILGFIRHLQQANLSAAGVSTLVMLQADFLLRQIHQLTKGGIAAFDNALRAAEVGFHAKVFARILRNILFYPIKDADIRMTETINRLLYVTDDKQVVLIVQLIAAEQINQLTLTLIGVLKLVHHNIFIALLILLPQRLILLQILNGQ